VSKGVNNNDIGYNKATGYVTVKGQDFIKPSKVLDGVSYDTVSAFNNAWNEYQKKNSPTASTATKTTATSSVPSGLVSTRQGLNSYGIDNSRIGYNNGNVTVDNRAFGQPTLNVGGTTYYTPSAFQSDYTNFQRNNLTNQLYNYQLPDNPYTSQIADQINYLISQARNNEPIDPYITAEYAARQAQAQRSAQQGIRAAQEALGSSGFGRSTMLSDRAQGIQNDANEYLETQVIPQILANEQARRQQEYANMFNLLQPLMSQQSYADQRAQMERGNIFDTLNYLNSEDQRGFQNAITQGQLTGNYMPPQAQEIVGQILQLKQAAESPGVTREQRAQLSAQADQLRSRLAAMGIDSSRIGVDVNYNTARTTPLGIPTMEAQQFAYQKARDAITDQKWKAEFDENVRQFGLNYALNRLQESNQQAYRQAQLALAQDDNARAWAQLDYQMSQPPSSSGGLTANQVLQSMQSLYRDPDTGKITTDSGQREQMFLNVVDSGLSDQETNQILNALGFSKSEINSLTKKYGGSSGN
jgi:hypothetical protein